MASHFDQNINLKSSTTKTKKKLSNYLSPTLISHFLSYFIDLSASFQVLKKSKKY